MLVREASGAGLDRKETQFMATTSHAFREYETIYILRSDVDADTADKVAQRVAEVVDREKGKLVKFESWGRRRLAYEVSKQRKGVYVYVKYLGKGGLVHELERNLRLADAVIKHITVQTNDNVDMAAVSIDPEEARFRRLEISAEPEETLTREKMLGLIVDEPRGEHMRSHEDDFEPKEEPEEEDAPSTPPVPAT